MGVLKATWMVAICLGVVLVGGCGKKPASEEIDAGTVTGSTYSNKYFALGVTFPADWSVQDRQATDAIAKTGAEVVSGGNKGLKAVIKAAEKQTVNLFGVFKHPLGSPVAFNPNLLGIAERVSHMPGIQRGSDYLFHARRLLEASPMKISFPKPVYCEQLGGVEFDVLYNEIDFGHTAARQKQYVTIRKGYALVLVASFSNEQEEAEIDRILRTVSLK